MFYKYYMITFGSTVSNMWSLWRQTCCSCSNIQNVLLV